MAAAPMQSRVLQGPPVQLPMMLTAPRPAPCRGDGNCSGLAGAGDCRKGCDSEHHGHVVPHCGSGSRKGSFGAYCPVQVGEQPCLGLPETGSIALLSNTLN